MIDFHLRRDLDLALLRFVDVVTVTELEDIIGEILVRSSDPPFSRDVIVDARPARSYAMSFQRMLSLADWLRQLYAGRPLTVHLVLDRGWKFGMANMFQVAASHIGHTRVTVNAAEAEVMAAIGKSGVELSAVFPALVPVSRADTRTG